MTEMFSSQWMHEFDGTNARTNDRTNDQKDDKQIERMIERMIEQMIKQIIERMIKRMIDWMIKRMIDWMINWMIAESYYIHPPTCSFWPPDLDEWNSDWRDRTSLRRPAVPAATVGVRWSSELNWMQANNQGTTNFNSTIQNISWKQFLYVCYWNKIIKVSKVQVFDNVM